MSQKVSKHGPGTFPTNVDYYETLPEGYSVYSWCPSNDGTGPATQVHVHLNTELGKIVLRLKSKKAVDTLISTLITHRFDVWGKL